MDGNRFEGFVGRERGHVGRPSGRCPRHALQHGLVIARVLLPNVEETLPVELFECVELLLQAVEEGGASLDGLLSFGGVGEEVAPLAFELLVPCLFGDVHASSVLVWDEALRLYLVAVEVFVGFGQQGLPVVGVGRYAHFVGGGTERLECVKQGVVLAVQLGCRHGGYDHVVGVEAHVAGEHIVWDVEEFVVVSEPFVHFLPIVRVLHVDGEAFERHVETLVVFAYPFMHLLQVLVYFRVHLFCF